MLVVQRAKPDPRLQRFVRGYVQRKTSSDASLIVEPIVARIGVMLEFQFAERYEIPVYETEVREPCACATLIGPITYRRVRLHIHGDLDALVVLFSPQGFHHLFAEPTSPLTELGTEADAVLGPSISALYQRLGNVRTFEERISLLDEFLIERSRCALPQDLLSRAFDCLIAPRSPLRVNDLFSRTGVSLRQFERKCFDYTGVSPRVLLRIARFQRALRLKTIGSQSWTQIAHALDYHDQMHMIRDFRAFTGVTPVHASEQIARDHLISLTDG